MRRWLAFAATVCAVAFVVSASASAAPPAATHRIAVNTPIFGYWWAGDPGYATIDENGVLSEQKYTPISADSPFIIGISWISEGYGHVKVWPGVEQLRLTITREGETTPIIDQTPAEGRAAWTPVFNWDDYWIGVFGPVYPFNEHMGTNAYAVDWENLIPGLEPGVYDVVVHETMTHVYNDLTAVPDWTRPIRITPFSQDYPFTITVQQ